MDLAERKKMGRIRRRELVALGYVKNRGGVWQPGPNCQRLVNGEPNLYGGA